MIITLRACARGKVIGCVIVVVVIVAVDTKITKSGDLGIWPSYEHNEYVEKLASVCLESNGMAYKRHK